jgi:hypothetical protein
VTQSDAVVLASAIGATAGVLGAIIGGVISYLTQRGLLRREFHLARTRELFGKRLVALQNLIFAIDFIERMRHHDFVDEFAARTWLRLTDETPCNLLFIPKQLRSDFDLVVRSLYAGRAVDARNNLDYVGLTRAKAAVQGYVDAEFENATEIK